MEALELRYKTRNSCVYLCAYVTYMHEGWGCQPVLITKLSSVSSEKPGWMGFLRQDYAFLNCKPKSSVSSLTWHEGSQQFQLIMLIGHKSPICEGE